MVIETMTFRLARGAEEAEFVAADARVQAELAYQQPGLMRRTTARGDDGEWLVVELWGSAGEADRAAAAGAAHPAMAELARLWDPASVTRSRYTTLD